MVVNDSRVIPARLRLTKPTGGAAEVLLLEPDGADPRQRTWEALVRPGRRLPPGTVLHLPSDGPVLEVGARLGQDGRRQVRFVTDPETVMDRCGQKWRCPPPSTGRLERPDRYQTVYAARPGSVAAPPPDST